MRPERWPLAAAIVTAAVTAVLLGAALAAATGDAVVLIALAMLSFVLSVAAGGLRTIAGRGGPSEPLVERAETTSKLAHELKNPLMAIRGLASTGARLYEQMSDEERREFFRLMDDEAVRLERVVEQAATAMRLDAGSVEYHLREEDLGALVEEVAWSATRGEHPLGVETRPGIRVRADRRYLADAIGSLIDNAAKYSPPDAPIEVSVRRGADRIAVVDVADRGPGIPKERMGEIFDRFGSWRPIGYEETPGAGLGLHLARAHVVAHGGRIQMVGRDDGGTIARVTLPATDEVNG